MGFAGDKISSNSLTYNSSPYSTTHVHDLGINSAINRSIGTHTKKCRMRIQPNCGRNILFLGQVYNKIWWVIYKRFVALSWGFKPFFVLSPCYHIYIVSTCTYIDQISHAFYFSGAKPQWLPTVTTQIKVHMFCSPAIVGFSPPSTSVTSYEIIVAEQ